jgi:hypothetical protein
LFGFGLGWIRVLGFSFDFILKNGFKFIEYLGTCIWVLILNLSPILSKTTTFVP